MNRTINLELNSSLWIYIEGIHFKDENPEYFQINLLEVSKGDILDLLNWFEGKTLLSIEQLCLDKLK